MSDAAPDASATAPTATPTPIPAPSPREPRPEVRPRLTVVESIVYQSPGSKPTDLSYAGSTFLEGEEQVYSRRARVGEEWTPLDLGWLREAGVSLVTIQAERRTHHVNLSQEELAEEAAAVVVVGVRLPSGEVAPFGQVIPSDPPLRFRPTDPAALVLRCVRGEARATVTVLPR